jgi:hypothetical protein
MLRKGAIEGMRLPFAPSMDSEWHRGQEGVLPGRRHLSQSFLPAHWSECGKTALRRVSRLWVSVHGIDSFSG